MRLSGSGYGTLLVVAFSYAVMATACADSEVSPDRATSLTTGAPSTAAQSPDGLECESDGRMIGHGDPAPEFAGHATPEEAVRSIASTFSVSGTPEHLEGDTWVIVSDAGLTVARIEIEPQQSGWVAGEIVACDDGSDAVDDEAARETLRAFFLDLRGGRFAEAAEVYGGSYETLMGWNPALDPQDHAALLENGCNMNGLQCLSPLSVTLHDSDDDTMYQFLVEFEEEDGSLLTVGTPPQTQFTYTVVADGAGGFLVLELPPYLP